MRKPKRPNRSDRLNIEPSSDQPAGESAPDSTTASGSEEISAATARAAADISAVFNAAPSSHGSNETAKDAEPVPELPDEDPLLDSRPADEPTAHHTGTEPEKEPTVVHKIEKADIFPPEPSSEVRTERRVKAQGVVMRHMLWAMGAGIVPLPLFNLAACSALQVSMLDEICMVYRRKYGWGWAKTFIAALIPNLGTSWLNQAAWTSLSSVFPYTAPIMGVASTPLVDGAVTYAMGMVLVEHFDAGGTVENLNLGSVNEAFLRHVLKGREIAMSRTVRA